MKNLKTDIDQLCSELSEQFQGKTDEERLSLIRKSVPEPFFLPFLEYFMKGWKFRSAYILKILIQNHATLTEKDFISYKGDISIDGEKFLKKGLILTLLEELGLSKTIKCIVEESKSVDVPELDVELFLAIDSDQVISVLYEEIDASSI